MHWIVPRVEGLKTAYVIGGGPSLKGFDFERLREKYVITTNMAFKDAPWAQIHFIGDCRVVSMNRGEIVQCPGTVVTTCPDYKDDPEIMYLTISGREGIELEKRTRIRFVCAGYAAINLAALLGARKIVLLGFDNRQVKGRDNYHDLYPEEMRANPANYETWNSRYNTMRDDLKRNKIKVLNATPSTSLTAFPVAQIEDVL